MFAAGYSLDAVNCLVVRSCVVLVVNVVEAECTTIVTSSWTSLCLLATLTLALGAYVL